MRLTSGIDNRLLTQRGHLFPWVPVCLAMGIGGYFALRVEPSAGLCGVLGGVSCLFALLAVRYPGGLAVLAWAIALICAGFVLAFLHSHAKAAPVLGWRYYGPVEGRVVHLDRSQTGALRMVLDEVRMGDLPPWKTPDRVRIGLHGGEDRPFPGMSVMTTAHLMPPMGPAEPGGFDFRRHAWFQQLGAVGYSRVPVLVAAPADRAGLRITAFRLRVSDYVQTALPGKVGGFAAALTTGDRSGVSTEDLQNLRDSNLAHLLAISGLHMGLLVGFVLLLMRTLLCAIPALALRVSVKRIAAMTAFGVALVYFLMSGGNVATERAFVMVGVALVAVMLDKRALSLRAVAVAATIVLLRRPETLLSPGFQMSFAATTALVAVFGWIRDHDVPLGPRWLRPALAVLISSAVAGAATAPIGAVHFNTLAHYGLLANLTCVPVMGFLVMPMAVLAAVLWPLGLDWIGFAGMEVGLEWILWVAGQVAGLDGAQGQVVMPQPSVLPLLAIGALIVMLWQGRARLFGVLPMLLALVLWQQTIRPAVLIADTGGLVGVMTDRGRALSKPKGMGFAARIWLENDGDVSDQQSAAARWEQAGPAPKVMNSTIGRVVHVTGKKYRAEPYPCDPDDIVIAPFDIRTTGTCRVFDAPVLARTGSLALEPGKVTNAADISGARIWSGSTR